MAVYSKTLAEIRQNLSSAVGDLIYGTFDSGSASTGVHTMLRKADDYYNELHYRCYIYGGAGIGQEREISDWDNGSNTLFFAPNFAATIGSTSQYELHYMFTEDEYRKAINNSIEYMADKYLIDKTDVTTTLIGSTYEYALPAAMYYVHRLTTEAASAGGEFDWEDVIDARDWSLIASRKLKLHDERYSITAGKDLRIEGQGRQAAATADTDNIYLPPDWLIQKAITFLPQNKIQSNKLDEVYRRALVESANEPRNYPNPFARKVVE